jgi:hypothetical protein
MAVAPRCINDIEQIHAAGRIAKAIPNDRDLLFRPTAEKQQPRPQVSGLCQAPTF